METRLEFDILPQPDNMSCGPTCLHALYRYYGDELPLEAVIEQVESLEGGGTLAVLLACHALRRGYDATIYTYNLKVFDPTWFSSGPNCRSAPRSVTGSPGPTWWHPLQPTSLTSRSPRAGSPDTGGGG